VATSEGVRRERVLLGSSNDGEGSKRQSSDSDGTVVDEDMQESKSAAGGYERDVAATSLLQP
jgi:hypothetical protein